MPQPRAARQAAERRSVVGRPALPGVMAYGATRAEAIRNVEVLALRVMADRLEHDEDLPELGKVFAVAS